MTTQQPNLFASVAPPDAATLIVLTCAFGEPWMGEHPLCEAHSRALAAQFDRDVAAEIYDAEGYAPHERKAQRKQKVRT